MSATVGPLNACESIFIVGGEVVATSTNEPDSRDFHRVRGITGILPVTLKRWGEAGLACALAPVRHPIEFRVNEDLKRGAILADEALECCEGDFSWGGHIRVVCLGCDYPPSIIEALKPVKRKSYIFAFILFSGQIMVLGRLCRGMA